MPRGRLPTPQRSPVSASGWPGSPGHQKTQDLVNQVLTKNGARIETDDFTATTPRGPIAVHNIIGKFNVTADPRQSIFILAGHYDTLFKPGFIGANDGASSTGILLAFADALKDQKTKMQIWLVWTDLEEALESFVGDDGLYGSRHLAQKLAANGTAPRIKGFFLLDMIGDKDLGVARETTSKAWLQDYIAQAAKQLGIQPVFLSDRRPASSTITRRSCARECRPWMSWTRDSAAWGRTSTAWANSTMRTPTRWTRCRSEASKSSAGRS